MGKSEFGDGEEWVVGMGKGDMLSGDGGSVVEQMGRCGDGEVVGGEGSGLVEAETGRVIGSWGRRVRWAEIG